MFDVVQPRISWSFTPTPPACDRFACRCGRFRVDAQIKMSLLSLFGSLRRLWRDQPTISFSTCGNNLTTIYWSIKAERRMLKSELHALKFLCHVSSKTLSVTPWGVFSHETMNTQWQDTAFEQFLRTPSSYRDKMCIFESNFIMLCLGARLQCFTCDI